MWERAVFRKIATPEERDEYRKWGRPVVAFYSLLFLAGLSVAIVHHYQSPSRRLPAVATLNAAPVAMLDHVKR